MSAATGRGGRRRFRGGAPTHPRPAHQPHGPRRRDPCHRQTQVVDVSTSKTGKHGHAKCNFVGVDIFTGKKYEEMTPSSHNMDVSCDVLCALCACARFGCRCGARWGQSVLFTC
jgi:hypothetical protein